MSQFQFRRNLLSVQALTIAALVMYFCLAAAGTLSANSLLPGGGDPFEITFDEFGNGQISVDGGPISAIQGVLAPDPTNPAVGTPVLTYFLPELVTSGDLAVFEPLATAFSDGLRFTNGNGVLDGGVNADRMIFYSDFDPNEPGVPADTGFPPNFPFGNFATIEETGVEGGFQGFDWFPGGNIYHGISDVPEPATVTLMGFGLFGMAAVAWRRRKKSV